MSRRKQRLMTVLKFKKRVKWSDHGLYPWFHKHPKHASLDIENGCLKAAIAKTSEKLLSSTSPEYFEF